ncbi:MAG: SDR family NAD(P)-dependent oxidoreductase [Acidimicrobiales bacterium]
MSTGSGGVVAESRVAVVTGAASGIGYALAERLSAEKMRVVMADVEEPALSKAAAALEGHGGEVVAVVTDVSKPGDVERLRDEAVGRFGAVHLLCNNAAVGGPHDSLWEISLGDWEWVVGVNLWGVVHGIRAFLPVLLEQEAAHVVNTSSIFGVFAGALGPYGISKHAVTALSETLYFQLQEIGAPVGVSVLCPGAVRTSFGDSDRNRPADLAPRSRLSSERAATAKEQFDRLAANGRDPAEVAALVVDGIRHGRFYILTSSNRDDAVRRRGGEIVSGGPPTTPFP